MDWSVDSDVWVERDNEGFARQLRHIQSPFRVSSVSNPYDLAVRYLRVVKDELDLDDPQIDFLEKHKPKDDDEQGETSNQPGEWLRWRQRRDLRLVGTGKDQFFETTVLVLQQTHAVPLPPGPTGYPTHPDVFGSSIRIVMHRHAKDDIAVTGATSTLRHNFNFEHALALARTPSLPSSFAATFGAVAKGEAKVKTEQQLITLLKTLLTALGLSPRALPKEIDTCIYRYVPEQADQQEHHPAARFLRRHERSALVPYADYPAIMLRVAANLAPSGVPIDTPPFDLFARYGDWTVLGVAPLMAGAAAKKGAAKGSVTVRGQVFPFDPVTQYGYPWPPKRLGADKTMRPNRPTEELDPARRRVDFAVADPGTGNPRKLRGDNVIVVDVGDLPAANPLGAIGKKPPSKPPGKDFDFESRTDDFAAVNAYWHLDIMVQRLALFGLPFKTYAPSYDPTLRAIHRAAIRPGPGGDGRCINAQVLILPDEWFIPISGSRLQGFLKPPQHKIELRFALADLPPRPEAAPLGIACDVRWVWHEFGHALIAGATGELELPFVHSVGDALAAINCDPGSALALRKYNCDEEEEDAGVPAYRRIYARGVTFPWVTLPNRRHDREASEGWSWALRLGEAAGYHDDQSDPAGYHREQVLSSTLFRLYRALGGDAVDTSGDPDVDRRRMAADYVTYLIVRGVGSLGRAKSIPALDASVLASALMDADTGTLLFDYPGQEPQPVPQTRVGGAVHKVVRWAFERQGLYARDEATAHGAGDPEPVDIYIDDGRRGEYDFKDEATATTTAVWLRRKPDNLPTPQTPKRNADNYIYVRVWNCGYLTAFGTLVKAWVARAGVEEWPDAGWTELKPISAATAGAAVPPEDQIVLGPFVWKPTRTGHYRLLVYCDAPGDRSNLNLATGLPCAQPASPPSELDDLVPFDNNIALALFRVT